MDFLGCLDGDVGPRARQGFEENGFRRADNVLPKNLLMFT
jgi:hypothetical protein